MHRLIALVGLPGSGKSVVCDEFVRHGFTRVYFGGLIQEEVRKRGMAVNEANERTLREDLRSQSGMAAIAQLALPTIQSALKKFDVVIDGLYSWEEFILLKGKYSFLEVVAIYAPPQLRYRRLIMRAVRPLTEIEAKNRDYAQIENLHQGGPIALADYTLNNEGDLLELKKQVSFILDERSKRFPT